ncbi:MAG: hypothetical protein NVS3B7_06580 [Candidatus Elarobacter sp.]
MPVRPPIVAALVLLGNVVAAQPAAAIPVFAHRYELTCQACHTAVPRLTAFGEAFLAGGYRLPGRSERATLPVAIKVNLAYGSETSGGLPKAVVDEVEALAGGRIGRRGAYFAEQYVVDGGQPGRTRDLWVSWRVTPQGARSSLWLRGGAFTLDLPVDPETFRETTDHYALWDQTAGDNPFTFFAPKTGLAARVGGGRGFSATVAALQAHDAGSGLPSRGIDRYAYVQHTSGEVVLSAYRLDGARRIGDRDDRFWREGYGASVGHGRARVDAVYQRGFDARPTADGALRTSGGFLQGRYELTPRAFALARYDATQDTAFSRALIAGAGYRVARNARFTVFDTMHRDAERARVHAFTTALLFAF